MCTVALTSGSPIRILGISSLVVGISYSQRNAGPLNQLDLIISSALDPLEAWSAGLFLVSMCCYCLVSVLDLIICTLLVTNVWNVLVSLYSVFRVGPKVLFNSLSPAPRAVDVKTSTTKKNRKKLRYFRLPPNLAHRKLIALANYVPSSSPLRVLSFTQRFFKNVEKWRCVVRSIWDVFA